ncbi:NAD(+) synthase [Flavobacteriaceae bacterium]|nr:NAD(+) synthase [Flavobacteriaceae bacterium]MDB4050127.1 NAD(+) synthase [Flavobacteriaceae bacterium]MDB9787529.1 NAD(+) synthase [Flavobacteriaceae bacterium]MDB9901719.1 NAD(+) synthase [Flavobacteriaceae bacterium]
MKYEIIADNIIQWLKSYAEKSKTNGFVVGISGGIDSALTSSLCANTGLPTLCIDMPILQSEDEMKRASKHIKWLQNKFDNVSHKSIDLNNVFLSFKSTVEDESDENNFLTLANSRSRIRMTTLYYFAGLNNLLVAGTGNKVEDFGIGFYTKYGDGGVDISPIADLNKTDVFEVSKILGVIDEIIKAKPTDGLWDDGRTDEDQIGATYKELEWAMKQKDLKKQFDDFKGREKEVFKILTKFNQQNLHKMIPIPIYKIPENLK